MKSPKVLISRIVILLIIVIISLGIGLNFYRSQTGASNDRAGIQSQNGNFPVYPGSRFLSSELINCPTLDPLYPECGQISYVWETTVEIIRVNDWYKENTQKNGWKFTGGAGSSGSFTTAHYEKNNQKINLKLSSDAGENNTQITKISVTHLN